MKKVHLLFFMIISIYYGNTQSILPAVQLDNLIVGLGGSSPSIAIAPNFNRTAIAHSGYLTNNPVVPGAHSVSIRWYDDSGNLTQLEVIPNAYGIDIKYGPNADYMMASYTFNDNGINKIRLARFVLQSGQYVLDNTQDVFQQSGDNGWLRASNIDVNRNGEGALSLAYYDPNYPGYNFVRVFGFECYNSSGTGVTNPFNVHDFNGYPHPSGFYGASPSVAIQENGVILMAREDFSSTLLNPSNPPSSDLVINAFTPADFFGLPGTTTHAYVFPGFNSGIKHGTPKIAAPRRNLATNTPDLISNFAVTYLKQTLSSSGGTLTADVRALFFEEDPSGTPTYTDNIINGEFSACADLGSFPVLTYQKDKILIAWRQEYTSSCAPSITSSTLAPNNGFNRDILLREYDFSGNQVNGIFEINHTQGFFYHDVGIGAAHEDLVNPSSPTYRDAITYYETGLVQGNYPKYWKQRNTNSAPFAVYSPILNDEIPLEKHQENYHLVTNPANTVTLTILNEKEELTNYTFYNTLGAAVLEINFSGSQNIELVDVSSLPKGLYVVKCQSNSFDETLKFLK